ncbi:hypothetical protein U1Q18_022554, partial [Sarracenia purpurea var. burkii]
LAECLEHDTSSPNVTGVSTATAYSVADPECVQSLPGSNLAPPAMLQFAKTRKISVERTDHRNRVLLQKRQFFHSHRAQVPFLFGVPAFETAARLVIHLIFRRTGRHLFLTDDDDGKPPLLKRMVEDNDEFYFMSALRSFKRRVSYSNVGYDHIVGWRTSSIRRNCELPKWEGSLNEKYPHIVYEEHCKACDSEQCEPVVMEDDGSDKLEEELLTGLSRVSWEKVDVSFHSSRLKSAAHSLIQMLKQLWWHRHGSVWYR